MRVSSYTEIVEKLPKYNEICVACCDLRGNHLLGIRVRRYTEIVLKIVLSRSEKPAGTMRFALHAMICDEIVSWA